MKQQRWFRTAAALCLAGTLVLSQIWVPAASAAPEDGAKASSAQQADKTETVYIKAAADGSAREITVSDVLKKQKGTEIFDVSNLRDIKNTGGDEEFTQKPDGTLVWQNHGEAIEYEGKSEKELPVSVRVSYFLAGSQVEPKELAGRSGRVRIRFDYENHTAERVTADGREVEVCVPFTVFSAMVLPDDVFSNISVTNGKLISMDGQNMVVGYAFPGLGDSLKLSSYEPTEKIDIPEFVEVSADVTDFELAFTATVAAPGLFADADFTDLDDVDEMTEAMGKLNDASAELVSGAGELVRGTQTFQSYMGEYVAGVAAASRGAGALTQGLAALNQNKAAIRQGAQQLENGLAQLDDALPSAEAADGKEDGAAAMRAAIEALSADVKTVSAALQDLESSESAMRKLASDARDYADAVSAAVAGAKEQLDAADAADFAAQVNRTAREQAAQAAAAALAETELSDEEKARIREAVEDSIDVSDSVSSGTAELRHCVEAAREKLNGIPELKLDSVSADTRDIEKAAADMQQQLAVLGSCAQQFAEQAKQMGGMLQSVKSGVQKLKDGSGQLTDGIRAFNDGVEKVYSGSTALSGGMSALVTAGGQLQGGANTLADGMKAFRDGVQMFDEEGIRSLTDLGGENLENIARRLRAVQKADLHYDNYSGLADGKTGSVKFIIETEEVKQ